MSAPPRRVRPRPAEMGRPHRRADRGHRVGEGPPPGLARPEPEPRTRCRSRPLGHPLDGASRQRADGLADNPSVRIEKRDGKDHLVLTGLDRLDEPDSLTELRDDIDARIPIVYLPEALLEVHSWTGRLDHFTQASDTTSRKDDMVISVAAALTASAMNVGMGPIGPGRLYRPQIHPYVPSVLRGFRDVPWLFTDLVRDVRPVRTSARKTSGTASGGRGPSGPADPAEGRTAVLDDRLA